MPALCCGTEVEKLEVLLGAPGYKTSRSLEGDSADYASRKILGGLVGDQRWLPKCRRA